MMAELGATRCDILTFAAGGVSAATLGFARGAEPGLAAIAAKAGLSFAAGSKEQFADRAYLDFFPDKALFLHQKIH